MSAPVLFFAAGVLSGVFLSFIALRTLLGYALGDGELAVIRAARVNAWEELVAEAIRAEGLFEKDGNEPMRLAFLQCAQWATGRRLEASVSEDWNGRK